MLRCTGKNGQKRIASGLFDAVVLLAGTLLLAGCEKVQLDNQVRELCAKDGGIKVYETVKVPPEKFDSYGRLAFWDPTLGENALGIEYILKEERKYYRQGDPEMERTHYEIWRRGDKKKLSEATIYSRRGGDIPGPWHPSSFSCPEPKDFGYIEKTFIRTGKE
jgi:hypothetical protein